MKIESLLPLGKLDPGLREPDTPLDVRDFARLSKVAEDVGLDAVLVEGPRTTLSDDGPRCHDNRAHPARNIGCDGVSPKPDRNCDVGVVVGEAQ